MGRASVVQVIGGPVWQWDSGRRVSAPGDEAHFARPGDDEALVVPVDGDGLADVPSQLLQSAGDLLCWAVEGDATIGSTVIRVSARPRPSDYVYTPTEVETVEGVKAWVEERIAEIESTGGLRVGHGLRVVDGAITVDTAGDAEPDNTLPITSAAVYVELGNIDALLATI